MKPLTYTNALLSLIAALLALIAWQQYDQRPVTKAEIISLMEAGKAEQAQVRKLHAPYVEVRGVEALVAVDVHGSITVDQISETVQVEVVR